MNAEEYANLERVEGDHWYYSGKRRFVREWISRVKPPLPDDRLLDCGAGTGRFAAEMAALCQVWVLDDHEEALKILRTRFPAQRIVALAGDRVPLPDGELDFVTALDVLEHVPDDAAVVRGFHRLLKPSGLAVVTVPAGMALWSDWDVALHHFRRYSRARLKALFPSPDWEVVHVNYTNFAAYPAVWLVRRMRSLLGRAAPGSPAARTEDRLPPSWLNALLRWIFVRTALWSAPMPFGVSLILVARKRA